MDVGARANCRLTAGTVVNAGHLCDGCLLFSAGGIASTAIHHRRGWRPSAVVKEPAVRDQRRGRRVRGV